MSAERAMAPLKVVPLKLGYGFCFQRLWPFSITYDHLPYTNGWWLRVWVVAFRWRWPW